MNMKKISIGLMILLLALLVIPEALAYPTEESACTGCHALADPSVMSISADKTTVTASQGTSFTLLVSWAGATANSAVKWPNTVLDNSLITANPHLVYPISAGAGSQSFTLTVPATTSLGLHTVRVYISHKSSLLTA